MEQEIALSPRTGGNENTGFIKLLAMLFMIVDHIGVAFFPQARELRVIGRIAFPLFAWCLCVGAVYTRNIWKYALRLLLVGALSQPFYIMAMKHDWQVLNIFFELLLGLLGIAAIRENRWGSRYWGPALAILAACGLNLSSSYGWKGVVFILLLYACRQHRASIAALMIAFCLYWGQSTMLLTNLFGVDLPKQISFLPYSANLLADLSRIQFWAILALPILLIPMKSRLRLPKWVPYVVYPGHLLVIAAIRYWDTITATVSQWM